ncbi:cytochrome P450 [Pseudonocardia sp. DSM 110487]|uniref:cytochrome P450 n=1 Tax=Pseudonocardia sp. DSM 110487 TaxID=2865833 RepID=UPI001C6A6863|nr:cytochrome P450 [Pseudonocardia sp. DSM 110487]QYN38065.1 cytochrome P450 [Pseudonocardia sp. DSM 110487]
MQTVPGPRLPSALQTALAWGLPRWWLDRCHRRYGDVFAVRGAPLGTVVFLADPDDIKAVFAGDPRIYRAGEGNTVVGGLVGESSVLLLDGQEHRERRRQMLPPFHRDAVRRQVEQMAAIAAADVATWPVGREFPVAPRMAAITLEVILRVVIGARDEHRLDALRRALPPVVNSGFMTAAAMIRPSLLDNRLWAGVRRARAEADRLLRAEIADRKADPALDERTDVLAMLVRSTDMSEDELRDQLMTLLLAGHETTATALSWTLERLVRHPDVLARAVRAADDGDDEYLEAIVKESLRVRPVLFDVARKLTEPVELGGHRIPAGVTVAPSIGLVQRSARHYPDPLRFDPDRMLGATLTPTTWLPFGGGARRCLGATFAQVEMRVVLREILRSVELAPSSARSERQRAKHITLVPHRGARIRVLARRPAERTAPLAVSGDA